IPCSVTSSRKYSTWIRFPNSRPCMSVKAVTTVSILPASASLTSSSTDSIPALPPGPPGRAPSLACSMVIVAKLLACGPSRSVRRDLVFLEGADRSLVLVLRGDQVPDSEDERDQDGQRHVVHDGPVEAIVPRQTRRRVWQEHEAVDHQGNEDDREDVHDLVAAPQVPGPWLELVALSEPQVDREDVGDVEAHGADSGDGEERERDVVRPEHRRDGDHQGEERNRDHGVEGHPVAVDPAKEPPARH